MATNHKGKIMEPKRAAEIIADAMAITAIGPWVDNLDTVMTPNERQEVLDKWRTMPGHTCFFDALCRIRDER
jgi:hypothetical protein